MESSSPGVLVFENLGKNSFSVAWLSIMVDCLAITLDAHTSSMYSIELIFDIVGSPRRSLSTSSSGRMWIVVTLSNWWSRNINLCSWSRYQILCLIAAWLEHQTLVLLWICWNFVLNRIRVNWLPSVFRPRLYLPILYHSINNLLIVSAITFPLSILLVYESHWKLAYVNWVIWVLHNDARLLLFVLLVGVLWLLDRSESASSHLIVVSSCSFIDCICSTWWYAHWLSTCLDISFTDILWLNRFMNCLKHVSTVVRSIIARSCGWEESLLTRWVLILGGIEIFLWWGLVLSTSCACSNTSYVCCICCIRIFSFDWLDYRIIQVDHQIIINCIFIRWFRLTSLVSFLSNCLWSSMESSNSLIWRSVLLLLLFIDGTMLNSPIIERVISGLLNGSNWWTNELIDDFPTVFDLFRVKRSCHV